jgi:hypothetical protein
MNGHFFRGGRWVVDVNYDDAANHLRSITVSSDIQLMFNYFNFLLMVDTEELGDNEFGRRHDEIKNGILSIFNKEYDSGARQLITVIEGIVRDSLLADDCIDDSTPNPNWTGNFHEHPQPTNFYQLLEGALRDPRSRIGKLIMYPPDEEISHLNEMIRNPLAHGYRTVAILEDFKVLFFTLILLYHDIVNPHDYVHDYKYEKWIYRVKNNLRLQGENPTLERLMQIAGEQGLNVDKVESTYNRLPNL